MSARAGDEQRALARLEPAAQMLDTDGDLARVAAWLAEAGVVLLGEASHGTREFYEIRAVLTRRLIRDHGFDAVAIEGDWPDAYRVNRHVQGGEGDALAALAGFERFPTWMWRNTTVLSFVEWLRRHNAELPPARRAGFFGLDLYSLRASMQAVIAYLDARDPAAAQAARRSYACFDRFGPEVDTYAWAATRLGAETCEEAVARELLELHRRQAELLARDGDAAVEDFFAAYQNARLARNAERYYRAMFAGRDASWNVRDEHMAEVLEELRAHLRRRRGRARVVVWAHNSHLGDARATEMGERGELNLGQLARERYGAEARNLGFTTFAGTVVAASDWGEPAQRMDVRPALAGSYEALFHAAGRRRFFLPLCPGSEAAAVLSEERLERAIGVIYRPRTERLSHYFRASLARQFDAILHVDQTEALLPLEWTQPAVAGDVPETFPSGT